MKLAFIGGGMMGEAMIAGAIGNQVTDAGNIAVCEVVAARRKHLESKHRVSTTESAANT